MMIKKSDITYDPKIVITSNYGLSAAASSGDGSAGNPWIIKDKSINPGSGEQGISIYGTTDYFILQNCNTTGGMYGFFFSNVQHGAIIRCNSFSTNLPAYIGSCADINCINCTFNDDAGGMTIYLLNSHDACVIGCNATNALETSSTFEGTYNYNVTITNCTLTHCSGIVLTSILGDNILVHNNTVTGATMGVWITSQAGRRFANLTVSNNTIEGTHNGIMAQSINDAVIENNTLSGMYLQPSIVLSDVENVSVIHNRLHDTSYGIHVGNSINSTFIDNDCIFNPGTYGIGLEIFGTSVNNTFFNNTVDRTTTSAFVRINISSGVKNTTFSGNIFRAGTFFDGGTTIWYNGSRGNYYHDHVTAYPYALSDSGTWWNSPRYFSAMNFDPLPLTPYILGSSIIEIHVSQPLEKDRSDFHVTADIAGKQGQAVSSALFFVSNATWKSANITMTNSGGTTWTASLPPEVTIKLRSDGLYSVNVYGRDENGVENWISRLVKIDDHDAPAVSIINPRPSFWVKTGIVVKAVATDADGVDAVWCRIRNSTWAGENHTMAGSPFAFTIDVWNLQSGVYYIDVFANDTLSNIISAQTWLFIYPGLHEAVSVYSNADFSSYHLPGGGTRENPWIIQKYAFDSTVDLYSIEISGTTDYVVIRDCKFFGHTFPLASRSIRATSASNIEIEDCAFVYCGSPIDHYVAVPGVANFTIKHCSFDHCGLTFIHGSFDFENVSITGCTFTHSTFWIDVDYDFGGSGTPGNNLTMAGNTFDAGIFATGMIAINISNNYFSGTPSSTIRLNCFNATIAGNTIVDAGSDAIDATSSSGAFVSGNNITRVHNGYGIRISWGPAAIWNNTLNNVQYFIANLFNPPTEAMHVYNNTFVGDVNFGGTVYDPNTMDEWDNGTIGNTWWNYLDVYPDAVNDGKTWSTPYAVPGTSASIHDNHPVVNASDPRSTIEFIRPGDVVRSNIVNVTVRLHVIPSIVQYSISDSTHYFGNYSLSEIKPNVYSLTMIMGNLVAGTWNLTVYIEISGETMQFTRFFDFVNPQMEILEPGDTMKVAGPFDVVVVCSNGATSASFQVVGIYPSFNTSMSVDPDGVTFRGTFDPSAFAGIASRNTLVAYASTPSGEASTSITFYYNAFPSTVDVDKPVGTSHVSTTSILVHANDVDGVLSVFYSIVKVGGGTVHEGFLDHVSGDLYSGTESILESGDYEISFTVTDGFNFETSSVPFPFSIDISSVAITSPLPEAVVGESFAVSAAFSGTPDSAWFYVTGSYVSEKYIMTYDVPSGEFRATFQPGSFPGIMSRNMIEVFIKDTDGNVFSASVYFKYDADPTAITIDLPVKYVTTPSTAVSASCTDVDGIDHAWYEVIDATIVKTGALSLVGGKYTATVLVGDLSTKGYTLKVYVVDDLGFENAAAKMIGIDFIDPAVTPVVPDHDDIVYTITLFPASVKVIDVFPVESVKCSVQTSSGDIDFDLSQISASMFVAVPPRSIPAGINTATFTARCESGRQSVLAIRFSIDLAPPAVIAVSVPANGTRITSSPFPVSARCTDDTAVESVSVSIVGASKTLELTVSKDGLVYSATANVSSLSDGNYTIAITAVDSAGRHTAMARTVSIDLRAPALEILLPVNGTFINSTTASVSISVTVSVVDESVGSVTCRMRNSTWASNAVPMALSADGKYRAVIAASDVSSDLYTVDVFVSSRSGRSVAASVKILINVPKSPVQPQQPSILQQIIDWFMNNIVAAILSFLAFMAGLLGIALVKNKRSPGQCIGSGCNI